MEFKGITYVGEEISDKETLNALPVELKSFYQEINGLVAYQGGLHMRGCVSEPEWHSLGAIWHGKHALWKIFPDLKESDIPFAQDCMGDQFVLRLGTVWLLSMDTGELDDLEIEFYDFLEDAIEDPVEFLALEPLVQFLDLDQTLEPGFILEADPPFSFEAEAYKLTAIPVIDKVNSHR